MNSKIWIALLLAGLLSMTAFGKPVVLKIDYSDKQQCSYSIEYTSRGDYKQKGTTTKKTTGVNCLATASFTEQNQLTVKVDTVVIKSDLYKDSKIKEMRENIMKSSLALSMANGYPSIDTSAKMPASEYLEWDIYRQLVKLLPILPDKPIKPGYTWEQTLIVPLRTARGTIPCELFRFYTFKKIHGDTATIVWNFRYAPGENAVDSTNALEEIPIGGNGSGSALIDVRNKSLISADMGFSTPVAVINDIRVTWRERAVFTLKHCK